MTLGGDGHSNPAAPQQAAHRVAGALDRQCNQSQHDRADPQGGTYDTGG